MMFKEVQNMLSIWVVGIFLLIGAIFLYQMNGNIDDLISNPSLWILFVVFLLMFLIKLRTRYDEHGIHIRFIPLVWNKTILWKDVQTGYMRTYNLMDFGGWGYRYGWNGTAINAKGKHGIQLILMNGRKILIGTQHPEEVQKMIDIYLSNSDV